jgi:hypothetical protein
MIPQTSNYRNRYNELFTFTLLENGNVLFSGEFKYCRFGSPNVYGRAYEAYVRYNTFPITAERSSETKGILSLEDFIEAVHDYSSTADTSVEPFKSLVFTDWDTIDMIDPSGGPYITVGQPIARYLEGVSGIIKGFKKVKEGYEIEIQY